MLTSLFSSLFSKFSAAALLVLGAAAGLALTGAFPGVTLVGFPAPAAPVSATGGQASTVNLDFPTSVLAQAAPAALPEEVVEEVVVVSAPRSVAPRPAVAPPAGAAAPACVADVTAALGAVTAALPTVTTPEQGQVLLGQAGALGSAANVCLAEAQKVGFAGVDQLVNQVNAVVGQVQALPVVAALTPQQVAEAPNLAGGIVGGVGTLVGGTLNLVGQGVGLLGNGLNFLANAGK
ncbi:MAG TPA: hypothetical protein VHJ78_03585 [Actinomycetota bacterium]|nr:hypothetical protein [Actinomycetota bacterium]